MPYVPLSRLPAQERGRNRRLGLRAGGLLLCLVLGLSGVWVVIAPAGDHPLLAALEMATGVRPERFMTPRERAEYHEAAAIEHRHKGEIDQLYDRERRSRWQGDELAPDEVRRIGSMQQTLTEMGRGERFVMDYLRTRADATRTLVRRPAARGLRLIGAAPIAWRTRRAR